MKNWWSLFLIYFLTLECMLKCATLFLSTCSTQDSFLLPEAWGWDDCSQSKFRNPGPHACSPALLLNAISISAISPVLETKLSLSSVFFYIYIYKCGWWLRQSQVIKANQRSKSFQFTAEFLPIFTKQWIQFTIWTFGRHFLPRGFTIVHITHFIW